VRLTSPARRALAGGLAFGGVATGIAWADSTRHGIGIAVAVLVALMFVVAIVQYAGRTERS
jgi:hypothetical protein